MWVSLLRFCASGVQSVGEEGWLSCAVGEGVVGEGEVGVNECARSIASSPIRIVRGLIVVQVIGCR